MGKFKGYRRIHCLSDRTSKKEYVQFQGLCKDVDFIRHRIRPSIFCGQIEIDSERLTFSYKMSSDYPYPHPNAVFRDHKTYYQLFASLATGKLLNFKGTLKGRFSNPKFSLTEAEYVEDVSAYNIEGMTEQDFVRACLEKKVDGGAIFAMLYY